MILCTIVYYIILYYCILQQRAPLRVRSIRRLRSRRLRTVDSKILGSSPWTWELHPKIKDLLESNPLKSYQELRTNMSPRTAGEKKTMHPLVGVPIRPAPALFHKSGESHRVTSNPG